MKKYGAFILIVCITISLFFPVYSVNEIIQDEPTFDFRPQPSSSERSASANQYTAIVDSTTDRWTVGDVIQYSTTAAPSGVDYVVDNFYNSTIICFFIHFFSSS